MILFLNFAPLSFGGGAERWLLDVGAATKMFEKIKLIDVSPKLANTYGRLVLQRNYTPRLRSRLLNNSKDYLSLQLKHFIPFTKPWRQTQKMIMDARLIYVRFEFLELGIILYFGGIKTLGKTIVGLHSPFLYLSPSRIREKMHNKLYYSWLSKWFLPKLNKIHVLNLLDLRLLRSKFALQRLFYIPNFVTIPQAIPNDRKNNKHFLHIAFIGELNMRKGVDRLINTILSSPDTFVFHIAGDGPMKSEIEKLQIFPHVHYYGYLKKTDVNNLLADCDVLFLPSRAESFSLSSLEAMALGLSLVTSREIILDLPSFIQQVSPNNTVEEYLSLFERIKQKKQNGKLPQQKERIHLYVKNHFDRDTVLKKLLNQLFLLPV